VCKQKKDSRNSTAQMRPQGLIFNPSLDSGSRIAAGAFRSRPKLPVAQDWQARAAIFLKANR
jgi:hypothetical protein